AQLVDAVLDESPGLIGSADVRAEHHCRSAVVGDRAGRCLGALSVVLVVDGDRGAVASEPRREATPDSFAGAGDEREFALEPFRRGSDAAASSRSLTA